MAIKRLTSTEQRSTISNRASFKARYKNFLSTIDADVDAVTNAATAKAAIQKCVKMIKVLARFTFHEADGE